MPTIRDRIIRYLKQQPAGIDDDELAVVLKLKYRQQANSRCLQLKREGLIDRQKVDGKIHNFWISSDRGTSSRQPNLPQLAIPHFEPNP